MKKFICLCVSIIAVACLFNSCKKDEDERDAFVGSYYGKHTNLVESNSVHRESTITYKMNVKKNGSDESSIVVIPYESSSVLFSTKDMKVVSTANGKAYCGTVVPVNTTDEEDGTVTAMTGLAISDTLPYSCAIVPNEDGELVLMFHLQTEITTTHNTTTLKVDTFSGTKE